MEEIVAYRTARTKHFDLGNGSRRVVASISPVHVPVDFSAWKRGESCGWDEHDFDLDAIPGGWRLRRGWMGLEIPDDFIGYRYQSRLTGDTIEVKLQGIDGVPTPATLPAPRRVGRRVYWDDVLPQLDFYLEWSYGKVEIFKRLRGPLAPKRYRWRCVENVDSTIVLTTATKGFDNYDWSDPVRAGTGRGRARRRLQMLAPVIGAPNFVLRPGFKVFTIDEEWTGMVIALDVNRVPFLSASISWPVVIDQDITENISVDNDDGWESGAWDPGVSPGIHYMTALNNDLPGYRYQTVGVPQGATIDAATLTLDIVNVVGTPLPVGTLYGNYINDAPAWVSYTTAQPLEMTPTTANVSVAPTAAGSLPLNVAAIVQEIVNRVGWAQQSMAFGVRAVSGAPNSSTAYIGDFLAGSGGPAVLTIDYTSGAVVVPGGSLCLMGVGN